jgi:hypothetical protein
MKASKVPKTHAPHPVSPEVLRRNCPCGRKTPGGEECAECEKKKEQQQLRRSAAGAAPAAVPAAVGEVLRSPGRSLPASARAALEPGFGRDFSGVRVHTDAKAAESARAVQARAYTVGQDVVFGAGQYDPDSLAGLHLLAHELAHTAQQGGGLQKAAEELTIGPSDDPMEREAEAAARRVTSGQGAGVTRRTPGPRVQRAPWGACPAGTTVVQTRPDKAIYDAAEKKIVYYYLDFYAKNKNLVFTNTGYGAGKLRDLDINDPFLFLTKQGFFTELRGSPVTAAVAAPAEAEAIESEGLSIQEPADKEPDVLDFNTMEVYDVTTENLAGVKVGKIALYLGLLNAALRQFKKSYPKEAAKLPRAKWVAGKGLPKPPPNVYLFKAPEKETVWICYGPTDFSGKTAGVIAYRAIESPATPAGGLAPGPKAYVVKAAGLTLTFEAEETGVTDLRGQAGSTAIAGFVLTTLVRGKPDRIRAEYAPSKGGAVLSFDKDLEFTVTPERELRLRGTAPQGFRFKYLSPGTMTLALTDQGITGKGTVQPSLPLLRGTPVEITLANDHVAAAIKVEPGKAQPAAGGARVTHADVGLQAAPELSAQGGLGFAFGPAKQPYADGALTFSAGAGGLVAEGKVFGHIPGVDSAEGTITYRNGQLSGGIKITVEHLKRLPAVTRTTLDVGFSNEGISLTGEVGLTLPGNQPATLGVKKKGDTFIYYGSATFAVPGLKDVKVDVEYDSEHFAGTGHTTFVVAGLHGDITVHYRDGKFSGDGKADIAKGKAKGSLHVHLSEALKLSGEGSLTYQLTDNLIGTAGVALHEDGRVRVKGALEFPKPITLFQGFGKDREVLHLSQTFPVPGLSIGTFGVVAQAGLRFGFSYGVGPGEFRNVKLQAGFDPLEADKNVEVAGDALLLVPAHAGVYLIIEGGLGVGASIGIASASATGGLTVRGDLGIQGGLSVPLHFSYSMGHFVFDARPEVRAGLVVKLSLGAYVEAKVRVGPFEAGTRRDWVLAAFDFSPGLEFGVAFPVHYDSAEKFRAPSSDDLQFEKPSFDLAKVVGGLFGAARGSETKK